MAGFYFYFPKMTGRMLNETVGKLQFVLMFVGFNLTFFPMHELGLAGMPRRIADYSSAAGWNDLNLLATIGGFTIAASMIPFLWNVFVSLRSGQVAGDDPWEGNTLEWATSSPPPPYNFDHLPEIRSERPLFDVRHGRTAASLSDATTMTDRQPRPGPGRAQPDRGARPRHPGRDQQPGPRDAPVHHLRGDVLRRPVRGVLQRARQCPASGRPRSSSETLQILPLVGPATILLILSSFTCQFAVWASGATTGRRSCGT